jgi:hypothetical protein
MRGTVPAGTESGCPLRHRSSEPEARPPARRSAGIVQPVTAPPDPGLPATLVWAVRLLLLEAAGLAALTAYLIYLDLTAGEAGVAVAVALTVLAALAAVVVAALGRALARRAKGARGPAVVVQLMVIATGGFLLQTGPAWLGLLVMALGAGVGVLLVLPPSTRALGLD